MEQKETRWWVKEFREELIKAYEGILPIEALKGGNPWFESFVAKVEEDARKDERERVVEEIEKMKKVDHFETDCPDCGGMGYIVVPDAEGEPTQQQCTPTIGGLIEENVAWNKAIDEISLALKGLDNNK